MWDDLWASTLMPGEALPTAEEMSSAYLHWGDSCKRQGRRLQHLLLFLFLLGVTVVFYIHLHPWQEEIFTVFPILWLPASNFPSELVTWHQLQSVATSRQPAFKWLPALKRKDLGRSSCCDEHIYRTGELMEGLHRVLPLCPADWWSVLLGQPRFYDPSHTQFWHIPGSTSYGIFSCSSTYPLAFNIKSADGNHLQPMKGTPWECLNSFTQNFAFS